MRRFAALYAELDASTATGDKLAALVRYFGQADPADAAWAVYFLAGGRPRQLVPTSVLRQVACELAGIDDWLFEECHQAAGDLAETIAHVLPDAPARVPQPGPQGLAAWVEGRLLTWRDLPDEARRQAVREAFASLDAPGRFLLVKLLGGGWRVGVSRLLVQRALAQHTGLDPKKVAERMMGYTDARAVPTAAGFAALLSADEGDGASRGGQPYPFFLAHPLADAANALGAAARWLVEWKYDGIRAQLVCREGGCWLWSRGEELLTGRFPEIEARARSLPGGTVLDGEVLAWREGDERPAPFQLLQQRITRKAVTRRVLQEAPVRYLAYDLLELGGVDLRGLPLAQRRRKLEALLAGGPFDVSPPVQASGWDELAAMRASSRQRGVEGLMLKALDSRYGVGRTRADGTWWKWKVDPLTVDGVLIYAQAGHGRRASVYTDYTFAVWSRAPRDEAEALAVVQAIERREPAREGALQLVPFAKAYSGLADAEFARVSRVVRDTTLEKFGPVRSVRPTLVFELGFEGLQASARHKSGIAVRFPRMLRVRDDKPLWQADTLDTLRALMAAQGAAESGS